MPELCPHWIGHLEACESLVLLLTPSLIGCHVEVGESHLEDGVSYPELVVPEQEGT